MRKMKIHEITSHRNGVGGNGFYVVRFDGRKHGGDKNMVAVVFSGRGNIAVLSIPLLADNNITFGENSWRGDEFEAELRAAIKEQEDFLATLPPIPTYPICTTPFPA